MIYLDNAATTYPKPKNVVDAVTQALYRRGANPGRSGYAMAMETDRAIYLCRRKAAQLFDVGEPENVIFTPGCTQAINIVLKGLLHNGDHVVVSDLEHNAVMRPLEGMREQGVTWTAAHVTPGDPDATVDAFRKSLRPNTKLIICTHASNVFGIRLPVERLAALAHAYDILFAVDAAQSAGVLPLRLRTDGIDFICAAGHKGLFGPMGTGFLITEKGDRLRPFCEGGTGSLSVSLTQPETLPDRFESGTQNVPGICGLSAGLDFVLQKTPEAIHRAEIGVLTGIYDGLSSIPGVRLYTARPDARHFAPVLSFNLDGLASEETGAALAERGIAVRCGLHCAPQAHKAFGTLETGTVRVSPSVFTTRQQAGIFVAQVRRIAERSYKSGMQKPVGN